MESEFGTSLGWLLAGVFLGWLGNWLFDRLYRRDGPAAGELTALRLEGLGSEIDSLRSELDLLRRSGVAAAAGPGATLSLADFPARVAPPVADGVNVAALEPEAIEPLAPTPEAEAPMAKLARRLQATPHPPWTVQEDAAAKARFESLHDYQTPADGGKPAAAS